MTTRVISGRKPDSHNKKTIETPALSSRCPSTLILGSGSGDTNPWEWG